MLSAALLLLSNSLFLSLRLTGNPGSFPRPLPPEEERACLERWAQGDLEARNRLVEHNLRLVVYIARPFENTGVNLEDLISIGTIGLIKAISTYRLDKKIKLATYASRCIENEILMYIRKTANQKTEVSLDEPINMDCDGNELLLSDILGTDEDMIMRPLEDDVDICVLRQALRDLPDREREIAALIAQRLTNREIAEKLYLSEGSVKQYVNQLYAKLGIEGDTRTKRRRLAEQAKN